MNLVRLLMFQKIIINNLMILLFAFLLFRGCCLSGPVTWQVNDNLKCGHIVISPTSVNTTQIIHFNSAFVGSSPNIRAITGIVEFGLYTSTSRYFGIDTYILGNLTSLELNVTYSTGTNLNSLKISYLCYDSNILTYLSSAYFNSKSSILFGTGTRQSQNFIGYSTGPINMSNQVYITPFLSGFYLDRGTTPTFFSIGVRLTIFNSTDYILVIKTTGTFSVLNVKGSRLTYDLTAVQQTQTDYIDTQYMIGVNSAPGVYNPFIMSTPENYFAGINNFSFTSSQIPQFTFSMATFSLEPSSYEFLNISTVNFRFRLCSGATPYYVQAEILCYDACPAGYYPESINFYCIPCYIGCLTCSNNLQSSCTSCNSSAFRSLVGSTCPCDPGYFEGGAVQCSICHSTCLTCQQTSANCTNCGGNRLLNGTQCICSSNSFADLGQISCEACGDLIVGCLTCSSSTVCTSCSASDFRVLIGNICTCTLGYKDVGDAMCINCSTVSTGCLNCTSASVCTLCDATLNRTLVSGVCPCDSGYYQSGGLCLPCLGAMVGCLTCSSSTVCTSCSASDFRVLIGNICTCTLGYKDVGDAMCINCSTVSTGCLNCTSASVCTLCDATLNRTLVSGVCPCDSGYYQSGGLCLPCLGAMVGCLTCSSSTVCTSCSASDFRVLIGNICTCTLGYKDVGDAMCINCSTVSTGCLNCTSASVCTLCDATLNRTLVSGVCPCDSGYYQSGGLCLPCLGAMVGCDTCQNNSFCLTCQRGFSLDLILCHQICGDGILFTLACDDGNLEDGDGCSSTCTIQVNFTCRDGSPTTSSKCSYNKPLSLELTSTTKNIYSNVVKFKLSVKPALKILNTFNFTEILSSDLPISSMIAYYSNEVITIEYSYTKSIQLLNASITLSPPTQLPNTFAMLPSETQFIVDPAGTDAFFFDQSQYDNAQRISKLLRAAMVIGFIVFIAGFGFWMIIGLETMNILQMLFFCMCIMPSLYPMFGPVTEINAVNGYNEMFGENSLILNFDQPHLPKMLIQMKIGARFIQNYNYMLLAEFTVLILASLLWMLNCFGDCVNIVVRETLLQLVIFNSLNIGFSFGIHMLFFNQPTPQTSSIQAASLVPAILALLTIFVSCYLVATKNQYFTHSNRVFKKDFASKLHPLVMCCYRFIVGIVFGTALKFTFTGLIILFLQIFYLLYLCWRRPYKDSVVIVRGILNEVTVTLIILQAYSYSLSNSSSVQPHWYDNFVWAQVIMVLIAVCCNVLCLLYGMFFRKNSEVKIVPTQNVTIDAIANDQQHQGSKQVIIPETPKKKKIRRQTISRPLETNYEINDERENQ